MDELFGVTEFFEKKIVDTEKAQGTVERKGAPVTDDQVEKV